MNTCLRCGQPLLNIEKDLVFCGLCMAQAENYFSAIKRQALSHLSDIDYSRYVEMKRELKTYVKQNGKSSFGWARAVLSEVDKLIGRENRMMFLNDVFGHVVETSKDLTDPELFALAMWGRPTRRESGKVFFDPTFIHDLTILQIAYNHQETLPGL